MPGVTEAGLEFAPQVSGKEVGSHMRRAEKKDACFSLAVGRPFERRMETQQCVAARVVNADFHTQDRALWRRAIGVFRYFQVGIYDHFASREALTG